MVTGGGVVQNVFTQANQVSFQEAINYESLVVYGLSNRR
jgi:hypothetical protein